jgi:hypothetical protein
MRRLSSFQVPLLFLILSCSKSPVGDDSKPTDVDQVVPGTSYEDVNKEMEDNAPPPNSGTRVDPALLPLKGTIVFDGKLSAGEQIGGYIGLLAWAGSALPEQATQISAGLNTDAGTLGVKLNVPATATRVDGLRVSLGPDFAGSTASLVRPDVSMVAASGRATATELAGGLVKVTLEDVQLTSVIDKSVHTLSAEITGQLRIDCSVPQSPTIGGNGMSNDSGQPLWMRDAELKSEFCAGLRSLLIQP